MKTFEQRVNEVFDSCRVESGKNTINVEGYFSNYSFDREELICHCFRIMEMLADMPSNLWDENGGSFFDMMKNVYGQEWGTFDSAEKLFCLGRAIHLVQIHEDLIRIRIPVIPDSVGVTSEQ
jgi:hypothetical protein